MFSSKLPWPPTNLPMDLDLLQGLFLPSFHKDYWMGLKGVLADGIVEVNGTSNRTWAWIDGVTGPPGQGKNYVHWGSWVTKKVVVSREPNNWATNEGCAVANASLIYSNAYGWSDVGCDGNRTSICKTMREWALFDCPPHAGLHLQCACRIGSLNSCQRPL
jgi:hypothetical protein